MLKKTSYFVGVFVASSISAIAQIDSLKNATIDSVAVDPFKSVSITKAGFSVYKPAVSFSNFSGSSPIASLSSVPGVTSDGNPFPQMVLHRRHVAGFLAFIAPAVIWDGVPYEYNDFLRFNVAGANVQDITIVGTGGMSGYGLPGANGGIFLRSKEGEQNSNVGITVNSLSGLFSGNSDNATLFFTNSVAADRSFGSVKVRAYYQNAFQPFNRMGDLGYKVSGHQGGVTVSSETKKLSIFSSLLAQRFNNSTRNYPINQLSKTFTTDVNAKLRMRYSLTSWLSVSALGSLDYYRNFYGNINRNQRAFYRTALDFEKKVGAGVVIDGTVGFQRDVTRTQGMVNGLPDHFTQHSLIATVGIDMKNFLWIRSTFQNNHGTVIADDLNLQPAFFLSIDFVEAAGLSKRFISSGLVRVNYADAYDYPQLLSIKRHGEDEAGYLLDKITFEAGVDLVFSTLKSKVSLTYFDTSWDSKEMTGWLSRTTHNGFELSVNQPVLTNQSLRFSIAPALSLARLSVRTSDGWREPVPHRLLSLTARGEVHHFFASVLANFNNKQAEQLSRFNSAPLREFSLGYRVRDWNRIQKAEIAIVGRNCVVRQNEITSIYPSFTYYGINLSASWR